MDVDGTNLMDEERDMSLPLEPLTAVRKSFREKSISGYVKPEDLCAIITSSGVSNCGVEMERIVTIPESHTASDLNAPTTSTDSAIELSFEDDTAQMSTIKGLPLIDQILESQQRMDTVITLKDGKLGAHRLVLAAVSEFLEQLLLDQVSIPEVFQTHKTKREKKDAKTCSTLILPDITKHTMELLLALAYTGSVTFTLEEETDLFSAMSVLLFGTAFDFSIEKVPPKPTPVSMTAVTEESKTNDTEADHEHQSKVNISDDQQPGSSRSNIPQECSYCKRTFQNVTLHIEKVHMKTGIPTATFGEIRIVSYCNGCNTQWKTLNRAQKCLSGHRVARCWSCLDVVPIGVLKSHYLLNHCDESSELDSSNTFVRCRWCSMKINIKGGTAKLNKHSLGHIRMLQETKGNRTEKQKLSKGANDNMELYETMAMDGTKITLRYQTLKGDETLELERLAEAQRRLPSPQRKYVPRPATIQKKIDNSEILKILLPSVVLTRIPLDVEDKIFRRTETAGKVTSEQETNVTLRDIEPNGTVGSGTDIDLENCHTDLTLEHSQNQVNLDMSSILTETTPPDEEGPEIDEIQLNSLTPGETSYPISPSPSSDHGSTTETFDEYDGESDADDAKSSVNLKGPVNSNVASSIKNSRGRKRRLSGETPVSDKEKPTRRSFRSKKRPRVFPFFKGSYTEETVLHSRTIMTNWLLKGRNHDNDMVLDAVNNNPHVTNSEKRKGEHRQSKKSGFRRRSNMPPTR